MAFNFNMTSFFAGVGTVVAAVTLGFAGGAMMTSSPQVEPNRLERVTAASTPSRDPGTKTSTPAIQLATTAIPSPEPAGAAIIEPAPTAPDRVLSLAPVPISRQEISPQPAPTTTLPVLAKDDPQPPAGTLKKTRDDDVKKAKQAARRAERRHERRIREIEAVENAMLPAQRAYGRQEVSQSYDSSPRFGFFGDD